MILPQHPTMDDIERCLVHHDNKILDFGLALLSANERLLDIEAEVNRINQALKTVVPMITEGSN
jgi:hypothetical protein